MILTKIIRAPVIGASFFWKMVRYAENIIPAMEVIDKMAKNYIHPQILII